MSPGNFDTLCAPPLNIPVIIGLKAGRERSYDLRTGLSVQCGGSRDPDAPLPILCKRFLLKLAALRPPGRGLQSGNADASRRVDYELFQNLCRRVVRAIGENLGKLQPNTLFDVGGQ